MSTIDLHSHSAYSPDGQVEPGDIVRLARKQGVHTMAITDHNSVKGVEEGIAAAQMTPGVQCLPGIEIDASWEGLDLHILGLGINYKAPVFAEIEKNAFRKETLYCIRLADGFQSLGFLLNIDALQAEYTNLTPELLIRTLLADSRNQTLEKLRPYLKNGARSAMPVFHMYCDYCLKGKPLFFQRHYMELAETLQVIHEQGGIPFLAHPGGSLSDFDEQLPALFEQGVSGVEAFSTYHTHDLNRRFAKQAKALGMWISCGSDFHGAIKPAIQLGQVDDSGYEADVAHSVDLILEKMNSAQSSIPARPLEG